MACLQPPRAAGIPLDVLPSGCAMCRERRGGQSKHCVLHAAGPGMGSTRLLNIRAHEQLPSREGYCASEVATLTRNNQKGRVTGAGRQRPLFPCLLPLSSSKFEKAGSIRSINEELKKKASNQLIL